MRVGVPRELKSYETRVSLTPETAAALVDAGHAVRVESGAGVGVGMTDGSYAEAGAEIVATADDAWDAELVVKVKEPVEAEWHRMRRGQVLFTYLHLAPDREQAEELMASGCTAIAYETVTSPQGTLPLLVPMSEEELRVKISAIFKHQSQKDRAPFPGVDEREFWQRVEERNRETARLVDRLGLPEYFAMEALRVRRPTDEAARSRS